MLVLFGLLEKQILVGGSRRVHSSPHLTLCLAVSNSALGLLYGHGILTIYENLLL